MRKMIVALILFSSVSDLQAVTTNFNSITISGDSISPTPTSDVRVWIRSGGSSGAIVGTASEVSIIPDAGGFFSTQTYIGDPGPWIFQTGSDYVVQLTSSTNEIISTFSITAVPFALTVRGDAQPGNQNIFGAYGNVGIGTTTPSYRLHITSAAGTGGDMLVVSTGASNVIRMTGAGEIYASKYYGDISGVTGLPSGDNLGNHTATTALQLSGYGINNASTITATGYITADKYKVNDNTVLSLSGTDNSSLSIGIGTRSEYPYGSGNITVGYYAGASLTTGFANTMIGTEAGRFADSGDGNTFVGNLAGERVFTGYKNTYIGVNSGRLGNPIYDTCIGALTCQSSGGSNSVLGYNAAWQTTGSNNIYIGEEAGSGMLDGDFNIVLGRGQNLSSPTASNELNIGGVIFGNLADKTVGISTRTPRAALDVVSTGTASNIYAQIWRASDAEIKSSMSATGVMMATKFIGDGSGLSGVTASGAVQKTGDTMAGQLTLAGSTLTVTGNAFSVGESTLVVAAGIVGVGVNPAGNAPGVKLIIQPPSNNEYPALGAAGGTLRMLSANGLYGLQAGVSSGGYTWMQAGRKDGSATAYNLFLQPTGGTVSVGTANNDQRLTVGGGIGLTGQVISSGTGNNYFAGTIGLGTTVPGAKLDVNGSISAANNIWSSGTVTATLFNGSGASLSALNASSLASGTVSDSRLSSNVGLLASSQTFTGEPVFANGFKADDATGQTFLNHYSTATVFLVLTGMVDNPSYQVSLVRVGNAVTMTVPAIGLHVKNGSSGALTLPGIPTVYRPSSLIVFAQRASIAYVQMAYFEIDTSGVLSMYGDLAGANISAGQTGCGWGSDITFSWVIK